MEIWFCNKTGLPSWMVLFFLPLAWPIFGSLIKGGLVLFVCACVVILFFMCLLRNIVIIECAREGNYYLTRFISSLPSTRTDQALVEAASRGHLEIVKFLLLDLRVNPSLKSGEALSSAFRGGHTPIVKLLISDPRVDISIHSHSAQSGYNWGYEFGPFQLLLSHPKIKTLPPFLLLGAIDHERFDTAKLLLSDPRISVNPASLISLAERTSQGQLMKEGVIKMISKEFSVDLSSLFKYGAMKNLMDLLSPASFDLQISFINAAKCGHMNLIRNLIRRASIESKNTGFIFAAGKGRLNVVKFLLDSGDVDPTFQKDAALRRSCASGHLKVVNFLLAIPSVNPGSFDNEAIQVASERGRTNIVSRLLSDPRVNPSANKNRAIRFACQNRRIEIVKLLLKDKRVNPTDNNNIALRIASKLGHLDVLKILLGIEGVDPSVNQSEAFYFAARRGHLEIVKVLIKDPRIDPATRKNSAFRHAALEGYYEICELLVQDPRVNPFDCEKAACRVVGDEKILNLLLDRSEDPSEIFCLASRYINSTAWNILKLQSLLEEPRFTGPTRNLKIFSAAWFYDSLAALKLVMGHPTIDPSTPEVERKVLEWCRNPKMMEFFLSDPRINPTKFTDIHFCSLTGLQVLLKDPRVESNLEQLEEALRCSVRDGRDGWKFNTELLVSHPTLKNFNVNPLIQLSLQLGDMGVISLLLKHPSADPAQENNMILRGVLHRLPEWRKSNSQLEYSRELIRILMMNNSVNESRRTSLLVLLCSESGLLPLCYEIWKAIVQTLQEIVLESFDLSPEPTKA